MKATNHFEYYQFQFCIPDNRLVCILNISYCNIRCGMQSIWTSKANYAASTSQPTGRELYFCIHRNLLCNMNDNLFQQTRYIDPMLNPINIGSPSTMLAQHWHMIESTSRVFTWFLQRGVIIKICIMPTFFFGSQTLYKQMRVMINICIMNYQHVKKYKNAS